MHNSTVIHLDSVSPEKISQCSPRHIQSVLEDNLELLKLAKDLSEYILTLNKDCLTIGAGKMATMIDKAATLHKHFK